MQNSIQNSNLADIARQVPGNILNAIKSASAKTGVNFAYLVQQAGAESSFQPDVKSKSSSATGLYQFIESTWLGMVHKYGAKYGLGDMAAKIDDNNHVASKADRAQILSLRKDPQVSSLMAAEYASENKQSLEENWKGQAGSTELYLAHFLGAGQASAFLNSRDQNPLQAAADLFPAAAKSNHAVFYDESTGRARSLEQVYAFFDKKFTVDKGAQYETAPDNTPPAAEDLLAANTTEGAPLPGNNQDGYSATPHNHYNSLVFRSSARTAASSIINDGAIPSTYYRLVAAPVDVMLMAQMSAPSMDKDRTAYN